MEDVKDEEQTAEKPSPEEKKGDDKNKTSFKMTPLGQIPTAKPLLDKYKKDNKTDKKGATDADSNIVHTDQEAEDKGDEAASDKTKKADQTSNDTQLAKTESIGSMDFNEYMRQRDIAKSIEQSGRCHYNGSDDLWEVVKRDGIHLVIKSEDQEIRVHNSLLTPDTSDQTHP